MSLPALAPEPDMRAYTLDLSAEGLAAQRCAIQLGRSLVDLRIHEAKSALDSETASPMQKAFFTRCLDFWESQGREVERAAHEIEQAQIAPENYR